MIRRTLGVYYRWFRAAGWPGLRLLLQDRNAAEDGLLHFNLYGRYPILLRRGTSDLPCFEQIILRQDYAMNLSSPPATILDCGANIGLSALYFHHRYPEARILSVEPQRSNFDLLEWNTGAVDRITCLHAAVHARDDRLSVVDPGADHWGYQTRPMEGEEGAATVAAFSIPTLLRQQGWQRINLLKIDIEGAERHLFSGDTDWLGRVDELVIELHDREEPGCSNSLFRALEPYAFRLEPAGENIHISLIHRRL
jgi:FkbM family methyltransferase